MIYTVFDSTWKLRGRGALSRCTQVRLEGLFLLETVPHLSLEVGLDIVHELWKRGVELAQRGGQVEMCSLQCLLMGLCLSLLCPSMSHLIKRIFPNQGRSFQGLCYCLKIGYSLTCTVGHPLPVPLYPAPPLATQYPPPQLSPVPLLELFLLLTCPLLCSMPSKTQTDVLFPPSLIPSDLQAE